jgi:hypothetical protein
MWRKSCFYHERERPFNSPGLKNRCQIKRKHKLSVRVTKCIVKIRNKIDKYTNYYARTRKCIVKYTDKNCWSRKYIDRYTKYIVKYGNNINSTINKKGKYGNDFGNVTN